MVPVNNNLTQSGYIKRIIMSRGFSFLVSKETGQELFFHASGCVNPRFEDLRIGQFVDYLDSTNKDGRPIAIGLCAHISSLKDHLSVLSEKNTMK